MTGAPLRGLRITSLCDDALPSLGKAFAELGAAVDVLRPPGDRPTGRPLLDLIESRGKTIDTLPDAPSAARELVTARLAATDAVIVNAAALAAIGCTDVELAAGHPHLVIAMVSDFGLTGDRADWTGSEAVYKALGGTLSRSGQPGRPPLLQPGEIFTRSAAHQIAWAILVAVYRSLTGPERRGAILDCSVFECGAVSLDPAFGMAGSGTPDTVDAHGRPDAADIYPIYRVRDGYVRLCLLSKGQWLAMMEWMGHPEELAGEHLHTNPGRWAHADLIQPLLRAFVAPMSCADVVRECRQRRIPASRVLSVSDVLAEEHFHHAGLLTEVGRIDGRAVTAAEGMTRIDGRRTVPDPTPHADAAPWRPVGESPGAGALSGLTVLDLGVIVAGAQIGALFAEQGARVIRVENVNFPDGLRRSFDWATPAIARGHRGKESVGLDLRNDRGRELFHELARTADIVVSNFKPGTVERLGVAYADLAAINPGIVCVETSAFGDTGPWRTAMGYGPLVRAGTGQTWLWRENADSDYFADGITIYPDHLVGRVCALAALACVLDRRRTGRGAHITVAQSDVALVVIAELLAAESLRPGSAQPPGDVCTHLLDEVVLQAAGDDQWCIVDPQTPEQLAALQRLVGAADRADLDAQVAAYVRACSPDDAARAMQAVGVPAGAMMRHDELAVDPALHSRRLYDRTPVAGTPDEVLVERYPVLSEQLPPLELAPTPNFGTHTGKVLAELGLTTEEIQKLFVDGVAQRSSRADEVARSSDECRECR